MKKHLSILLVGTMFFLSFSLNAQDSTATRDYDYNVALDFQTRYVWRGQLLGGTSPSRQPGMSFSWKGLSVGAWGAFGFNNQVVQELDLYLSYTFWKDRFTVCVTDYCFPDELSDFNYFDWKYGSTSHVIEAGFCYNGEEKVPISLSIYCNLYGGDAKNAKGRNLFSSYAELAYNPTFQSIGVDFSVWVGCALNGQNWDENILIPGIITPTTINHLGFYGNKGFACVNTGIKATKTFNIKKLSIPLGTALIFNPVAKKAYFVASFGIAL
ncbi:MAG: hypothetical protein LBV46_04255 [Bacteroidales bacterium]|jgi:hypothetical protein|nr:hypothetical protein [Bacteroidales bacterium]